MSRIFTIAGNDEIPETPLNISGFETEGEMDLKLARQAAELELGMAERIAGIGSPRANSVSRAVADYSEALAHVDNPAAVAGIGSIIAGKAKKQAAAKKQQAKATKATTKGAKKTAKKAVSANKKAAKAAAKQATKQAKKAAPARTGTTKRRANFIKRAGQKIKQGAKAVTKIATAPQRLLVKGLGEVFIPKMAPLFLYLFITNPATIATLPAVVQRKRRKAEKFAKFMTGTIGMKEAHFMKLVRNGIIRQKKQTPEQLLSLYVKGSISGVGAIGIVDELIGIAVQVITKIAASFGKKASADETPGRDDAPDLQSDFAAATPKAKRQLLVHLQYKPESQKGREPAAPAEEAREARQEASAAAQLQQEPDDTPVEAPLPEPASEPSTDEDVQATEAVEEAALVVGDEPTFSPAGSGAAEPAPATSTKQTSLAPLGLLAAALLL